MLVANTIWSLLPTSLQPLVSNMPHAATLREFEFELRDFDSNLSLCCGHVTLINIYQLLKYV